MGTIHYTPNDPITIKLAELCVPVRQEGAFNAVFTDARDAAIANGLKREDVISACGTGKVIKASKFIWPTLKEICELFPNYRVVHHPLSPAQARPTTVHVHTPGRYGRREDLDYRAMSSARTAWGFSKHDFECIVAKSHGWQKLCPPAVVGITVHDHGWKPPKDREFVALAAARGEKEKPDFECRQNKSSISIKYVGATMAPSVRDMPGYVLNNCIWTK